MNDERVVKSTQEQAVSSWINYLNEVRITRLLNTLEAEQGNLENAIKTIDDTLEVINKDIVNNGLGRGGTTGMHGFIAEVAECGIGNARQQILGKTPIYEWINDNGPEDLRRGAVLIQQKFVQSGNHLSLNAVQKHLHCYPDFLNNGGKYQIPADHYEKICWLLSIPKEQAEKMSTSTGEFSLRQWKEVQAFFESGEVPLESLEPSTLDYRSVQRGTYEQTLNTEKKSLEETNTERKGQAYQKSKPSLQEGTKATVAAAIVEGGMTLCLGIIRKRKAGKRIVDFDHNDWAELSVDSGKGFAKGGVRGASIYLLTNFSATPAAVASSIVTASFGIAEQAHLYRLGELDKLSFIENSETVCLDATISALSAFAGQLVIPIPVLGAVVGNAVGTMMYQLAKDTLEERESAIIAEYLESVNQVCSQLDSEYEAFAEQLSERLILFMGILERAFSPDIRIAFEGSIMLAKQTGVPEEEILDNKDKIFEYFLE